jgi:hypothetical protein
MKVLYVTGGCLTKNTSANMSHNGFVKGILDCGHEVDIIMANDSYGEEDKALIKWENAQYFEFESNSIIDKLKIKYRKLSNTQYVVNNDQTYQDEDRQKDKLKVFARSLTKKLVYLIFPLDPIYPLEKTWLKNAEKYSSNEKYDIVISNSSPAASHKLVSELFEKKRIICKRWVQIWEDPWFYDLYGGRSQAVKEAEHDLLMKAQEVFYVSPLTLMYQKKHFADCAHKMKCVPLPFYEFGDKRLEEHKVKDKSFGYFGDYFSHTRNLLPFYEALKATGYEGNICGDSDLGIPSTEKITVSGRVTLDILAGVQAQTQVLVHLCNLSGGQIPGKIYHYSATNKPILFILDGTKEEIESIKSFFEKYDRYYFCNNNVQAIIDSMNLIFNEHRSFTSVREFEPINVVEKVINEKEYSFY